MLWTGTLINRLGTMVEPFLAVYLTGGRGMSVGATGVVLSVFGAGSVLSQFLGGVLTDAVGRRATLTVGMVTTGAAMLTLGYVRGLPAIVAAVFVLGVTIDLYRPAASALVADLVPPAERPRAYGLVFWAINLGFAVSTVLGGVLARLGFSWLFWADAATCVAFGVLVWRAVPETGRRGDGTRQPGGFGDVLRDRLMVGYALIGLAYCFVYTQSSVTLPLAMHAHGLSPEAYGAAIALNGVVIVAVQPLVGHRLGRLDHSCVLAAGMTLVGLGFGLTVFARSTPAYAGTVVVWTFGEIAVASVMQAIVADLAPRHLRGRYNGLNGMAWAIASLAAPLGGTRLLELGPGPLWLGCAALCTASAAGQLALAPAIRRRASAMRAAEEAAAGGGRHDVGGAARFADHGAPA